MFIQISWFFEDIRDGGGGVIFETQLQKVVSPKTFVVPSLGAAPKAICKVSRVIPLYNMVNLNMTISRNITYP